MNEQQKIEKNLADFYVSFKDAISYFENTFVQSIAKAWPNFILIKTYSDTFKNIVNSVKKQQKIAKYWIFDSNYAKKYQKQFKSEKLFPVKNWLGMYLKTTDLYDISNNTDFKVERLKFNEIEQFVALINHAAFNKKTIDVSILKSKFEDANFHFFVGKYKNQMVSTCLIFDNATTNGLYFLTTKKEFRSKGFGNTILKKTINSQIKNGNKEFVLHANKIGISIYEKLGFKEFSKLRIFVKI